MTFVAARGHGDLGHRDQVPGRLVALLVDHARRPGGTAAGPARSPAGTRRSAAAACPGRPAARRTRPARWPARPSSPAPARPRRAPACSGGSGRGRAGPGPRRTRRPPRRARWPPAPGRRRSATSAWPCWSCRPNTGRSRTIVTPGVSTGTSTIDCCRYGAALGVGLAHRDQELAARVERAGGPPLAAGDDVLVAVALDPGGDVGRVRGGDVRLGHRERRTGSCRPAAAPATAASAPACRAGAAAPCCRCPGRRS